MGVSSLVVGVSGWSSLATSVTLDSEPSSRSSSGGESSQFSVLVDWVGNPVDSGVISDSVVSWVNKDDFVELVGSVLSNPIAVKDSQSTESSSNSLFSNGSEVSGSLELVDTHGSGLSSDNTLGSWSLSSTSSDSDSVDNESLLSSVAELSGFVGS